MNPIGAPLLAYLLDHVLGDPPNRWHPVAWQGQFLRWMEAKGQRTEGRGQRSESRDQGVDFGPRRLERVAAHLKGATASDLARFAWGAGALATGMALSAGVAWGIGRLASRLPWPLRLLLEAFLLKLALASRGLDCAAGEVEAALRRDDLPEARRLLGWHLVSRDISDLSAEEVAGAAVESVAENVTDGLIAPLCAWVVGGLPAVWAYRFCQTADSMWGYHDPVHEWLGKPAARLDDVLNWLPARLSAALLIASAALCGEDARQAWRTRCTQASRTASPNAGQTMAAMAGALRVTLTKRGHYTLAGGDRPVTPDVLRRARRVMRTAAILGAIAAALISFLRWRASETR